MSCVLIFVGGNQQHWFKFSAEDLRMFRYYYVVIVLIFLKILFWTFFFYLRSQRLRQLRSRGVLIIDRGGHVAPNNYVDLTAIIDYEERQQHYRNMSGSQMAAPPPPYSEVVGTTPSHFTAVLVQRDTMGEPCKPPSYDQIVHQQFHGHLPTIVQHPRGDCVVFAERDYPSLTPPQYRQSPPPPYNDTNAYPSSLPTPTATRPQSTDTTAATTPVGTSMPVSLSAPVIAPTNSHTVSETASTTITPTAT